MRLLVVILLYLFCETSALECYTCNSRDTKECDDPFTPGNETPKQVCHHTQPNCLKVLIEHVTMRTCASEDLPKTIKDGADTAKIYICNTDSCNSSKTLYISAFIVILMTILNYVYVFH